MKMRGQNFRNILRPARTRGRKQLEARSFGPVTSLISYPVTGLKPGFCLLSDYGAVQQGVESGFLTHRSTVNDIR